MRRALLSAALALALSAVPAASQVAVDSVEVQIYAPGDIVVTIAPRSFRGLVGDTVRFSAVAIDAPTGDTIPAILNWSTPNPEAVSIDPMTGEAVFLSRGRWRIRVEVERAGGIVMFQVLAGQVVPIPVVDGRKHLSLEVGEQRQLCAYITNAEGTIVGRSAYLCPFPGESPEWAFTWPSLLAPESSPPRTFRDLLIRHGLPRVTG